MVGVWTEVTLGEVVNLKRGYDLAVGNRRPGNVPVISSSGFTGFHDESKATGPGVVTGRYGTLGEVFYIEGDFWPLNTSLYVQDFKGNDPRFVSYFLRTLGLSTQNVAGAVPGVNRNFLHMLRVRKPPLPTQLKIAAILSAYDDLIENNTRRIAILEEMARALYREWFVEFRFPRHKDVEMVESGVGLVPAGWELKALADIASDSRRGVDPQSVDGDTPYVGLEHLPRRSIALQDWGAAATVQSTKLAFERGDILFGKIRPYFHKVSVAPVDGICSSDAIVIRPREARFFGLTLTCVSSDDFVAHATQTSQGTKMPRANWDVLLKYTVAIPTGEVLQRFNELVGDIVTLVMNLVMRNRTLHKTRDLLLPRLISGELDVSELDIDTGELGT